MSVKLAILDLNDNTPNLGLLSICQHVDNFASEIEYEIFDVRHKHEIPDLNFDIYISSGGPGDPRVGDGIWEKNLDNLLEGIIQYNLNNHNKKYVFLICHSFQMGCLFFNFGNIGLRYKKSFGTYPCYLTGDGMREEVFENLPNPMYIADFRSFEVIDEGFSNVDNDYPKVLAVEQLNMLEDRPRAIMAVKFTPEIIGTQFHPEAYADGMYEYFNQEERKKQVVEEHGEERMNQMIRDLAHPMKISLTNNTILPNFLRKSLDKIYNSLKRQRMVV